MEHWPSGADARQSAEKPLHEAAARRASPLEGVLCESKIGFVFMKEEEFRSELNEEFDGGTSSDKWWFDSYECSICLECYILKTNCSQQYLVENMLITYWVWGIVQMGAYGKAGALGNAEFSFIAIVPRYTLACNGNIW